MNSLFQLDIPKRHAHCCHQGERLVPGMEMYSLLVETETETYLRRDFCLPCWSLLQNEQAWPPVNRGYWKSKIELKKIPPSSTRTEKALVLLRELLQAPTPSEEEIFVLCLFLAHARQLALRQELQKEGNTYYLYEVLGQEEFFTIKVCALSSLRTEELQRSLSNKI